MLDADAFDVFEDGGAARAHQLHGAAVSHPAERDDGLDGVSGLEGNIQEHQGGSARLDGLAHAGAVWKFDRVDTGPVQHQREEMPDARLFIDHVTDRAPSGASGGGSTAGVPPAAVDDVEEVSVIAVRAHHSEGNAVSPGRYWCAKLFNYGFPIAGLPEVGVIQSAG